MRVRVPIKTSYCPHCNANIPVHADDDYLYGSPIQTCPKCNGQYLDRHYHEAEIDGFDKSDISPKAVGKDVVFYGAAMLVTALINVLLYFVNMISFIFILILIGTVFLFFSTLKKSAKVLTGIRKKELDKELLASQTRLADKEYARTLKELGYAVPEKYL